jgi:thioester reductase-like protein
VDKLLARGGERARAGAQGLGEEADELRKRWGAEEKRVVAVVGDLARPGLGIAPAELAKLKGKVKHFFHLAAVYDLSADAPRARSRPI